MFNAANEDFRVMMLFAAFTGVRAGEQWAARCRDVDLKVAMFTSAAALMLTARKARLKARPEYELFRYPAACRHVEVVETEVEI